MFSYLGSPVPSVQDVAVFDMKIAILETTDTPPFVSFGGLIETGAAPEQIAACWEEWSHGNQDEEFADWLIKKVGCREIPCGYVIVGD